MQSQPSLEAPEVKKPLAPITAKALALWLVCAGLIIFADGWLLKIGFLGMLASAGVFLVAALRLLRIPREDQLGGFLAVTGSIIVGSLTYAALYWGFDRLSPAVPITVRANPAVVSNFLDAVSTSDLAGIQAFLRQNPWIIAKSDAHGTGALHAATRRGDLEVLNFLLQVGAPINLEDANHDTPLSLAVESGREDLIRCLLAAKADAALGAGSPQRKNLLAMAMHRQMSLAICDGLYAAGARPLETSPEGGKGPLLVTAVRTGSLSYARWCLEHGERVDDQDPDGNNALHRLLLVGDPQCLDGFMAKLLFAHPSARKAIKQKNAEGRTPEDLLQEQQRQPWTLLQELE